MIKLVVLPAILFSVFANCQGDSSSYERLLTNCRNIYTTQVNGSSVNFFNALLSFTRFQFRPENPLFVASVEELKNRWSQDNKYAVCLKVADSIYTHIRNSYLWTGHEVELLKFKNILQLVNEKYCPCISKRPVPLENTEEFSRLNRECDTILMKDFLFINVIRAEIGKLIPQDRGNVQPFTSWFQYQHCPAYTSHINASLLDQVRDNLDAFIFNTNFRLPKQVATLYQNKAFDSLLKLFPGYKTFKKDIESTILINIQNVKGLANHEKNEKGRSTIIRTTYYTKVKTVSILGQTLCEIDNENIFNPIIRNFQFITPKKINNYKELLAELEVDEKSPPPLMEIIKEVRIDTTKGKN